MRDRDSEDAVSWGTRGSQLGPDCPAGSRKDSQGHVLLTSREQKRQAWLRDQGFWADLSVCVSVHAHVCVHVCMCMWQTGRFYSAALALSHDDER